MADLTLEQKQALAIAMAKKKRAEEPGALTQFSSGFIQGTAKTLGAPVDMVNALLGIFGLDHPAPLGGSESIQRGFSAIGLTDPERRIELGRAGAVGDVAGQALAAGPAVVAGGVRSLATAGARRAAGQTSGAARGVVEDVAETAIRRPGRFMAAEATAAGAAGLAGFEAAQRFPDSQGAKAMAEIAGGFTPAGAGLLLRGTGRALASGAQRLPLLGPRVASFARNFTVKGATRRARARIRRAIEDPDVARERLKREDVLPGLTVAQRIGDENLLALERSIMESTPELSMVHQRQLSDVNRVIRESLEAPAREVPTLRVKEYFQGLLDARLQSAAARADDRLAELGTSATREDLNRIAREELLAARIAAREQEKQLHNAIPESARVPVDASENAYQDFLINLPAAQREDIPAIAHRFLNPNSKKFIADEMLDDGRQVTNIREMRGLYGKLREQARIARADKKFNRARIADDLADAINEDIADAVGGPEVREAVDIATTFSVDFNDRFTRGEIGRLLGAERAGGPAVAPGLTLETTVGARGPRAREATDALLEAVRRSGDEEAMRGHIQDFLMDDFRRAAVKGGRVDTKAAERYLRDNQDVLARFPETRRAMERSRVAGEELTEAERMTNPKISRAAVFIKAPPGEEIERVIATARPAEAMEELLEMARRDPTGHAVEGLKAAFMDFLKRRSELTSGLDVEDRPFVSGARLSRLLDDPEVLDAMKGLFKREELRRISKVKQTAIQLDRARAARGADEGIIGDAPGVVVSMMGRILSAQFGRVIAGQTGGGTVQTPGIMASQAQKILQSGVKDPASRLLTDAIRDEKLFKSLLLPMNTLENQRKVRTRLNAWVLDVLREQQETEEEGQQR